jgi:signal transduction histidine kinase
LNGAKMNEPVRLADFIRSNMEQILQEWEDFARTITPPALTMDSAALRDHAELMLETIAKDLETSQTSEAQSEKSKGRAIQSETTTPAQEHAKARLESSFTTEQLFSEYRALRASVLHLWSKNSKNGLLTDPDDITRFNEAIDQAIAESVAKYSALIRSSQNMFLGILSHDLRNPLNTISMSSILMMQFDDVSDKVKAVCQRIFNSAQRMNKLIIDLLDYTHTQLNNNLPTSLAATNMAKICEDIVYEMQTSYPDREFVISKHGSLDGVWDKERIAQVFSNLLGNAVQHGRASSPIEVELDGLNDFIKVRITNQGPVIPQNRLDTIFDPLCRYHHDESNSQTYKNSLGLGLYITREIVIAHKGSLNVISSETLGTTFSLTIPRDST